MKLKKKLETIKIFFTDVNTNYLMKWQKDVPGGYGWETTETAWMNFDEAKKESSLCVRKEVDTIAR